MSDLGTDNKLGLILKKLLKEQSLSMRNLSVLTEIDVATISRIINGKRKANPVHLQKFADSLDVPIVELFVAAGFAFEQKLTTQHSDIYMSVDSIQKVLETSDLYDSKFTIESVEQQLAHYKQYVQTEEGQESILKSFGDKLKKIGSIGPFISQLKDMYKKFCMKKATPPEIALMGSVLMYFIVSVDVIPDYIFPVGYIDDAMAVQIVRRLLSVK